ncbi:MAG: tRNA (adenosine(37)-N6)-dimethylallyltransferase MiaA [Rhodospirillales bacterium]|nr:tRNA (adenosine(37)-N6)-dimethylallyltransferase MiaA [Rhodospirillales bacterium]
MTGAPVIVIFGPTASGKSSLAIDVAREFDGVIVNADSMQVYEELRVLTARPGAADEALVPHKLYGVLSAAEVCSAGRWLELAVPEIEAAWGANKLPIVVGGTGLYIRALMEGLNDMPEIPDECREAARSKFAEIGPEAFHELLAEADPISAARIGPSDPQRMMRAYEVYLSSGRPLSEWQAEAPAPPLDARFLVIALRPDRDDLYAACDGRAAAMLADGALDEAAALAQMNLDPGLPAMKALGVPDLLRHIRGEASREEALASLRQATRNYAKRQMTWLNHQISADLTIFEQYSESFREKIFSKVRKNVLTAQG